MAAGQETHIPSHFIKDVSSRHRVELYSEAKHKIP